MHRKLIALALPITAAFIVGGCGSSDNGSTTASTTDTAMTGAMTDTTMSTTSASTTATAGDLSVTVGEMFIHPGQTTIPAGTVHVTVDNQGTMQHEVVFLKTDVAEGKLPVTAGEVSEDSSVGEVGEIAAGTSKSGDIKLTRGTYVLVCNLPGHYQAGMHATLKVT